MFILVRENDGPEIFQRTIAPYLDGSQSSLLSSGPPSTFSHQALDPKGRRDPSHVSIQFTQLFSVALQLSSIYRKVLTSMETRCSLTSLRSLFPTQSS